MGIADRRAANAFLLTKVSGHPFAEAVSFDQLMTRCCQLPVPQWDIAELPYDELVEERDDFINWACKKITSRPQALGTQLINAWVVFESWHHASREERQQLQKNWHRLHCNVYADEGSYATTNDLEVWQRECPTLHFDSPAMTSAALAGLLDEVSPDAVQHSLSSYLGPDVHLPTLSWILGALAQQSLLHRFDFGNRQRTGSLACVAAEQLSKHIEPSLMVLLLSQLTHEIWWHHRKDSRSIDPSAEPSELDLETAIEQGDFRAAQRTARRIVGTPDQLWRCSFEKLNELEPR